MELLFRKWLAEDSYGSEDIAEYYFVCCNLNIPQLQAGELIGVRGVTTDVNSAAEWFLEGREIMLKMPGQELVQANDMSRIMYKNPDYMASNNFSAWRRVNGSTPADILKSVLGSLGQVPEQAVAEVAALRDFKSATQLAKMITLVLKKYGVQTDYNAVLRAVQQKMTSSGGYNSESEWRVKNQYRRSGDRILHMPNLKLPKNTEMMVVYDNTSFRQSKKQQLVQSGLMQQYRTFVSYNKNWFYSGGLAEDCQKFASGNYTPATDLTPPQAI